MVSNGGNLLVIQISLSMDRRQKRNTSKRNGFLVGGYPITI